MDVFLCVNEIGVRVSSSGVRDRSSGYTAVLRACNKRHSKDLLLFLCFVRVCVCVCGCLFVFGFCRDFFLFVIWSDENIYTRAFEVWWIWRWRPI